MKCPKCHKEVIEGSVFCSNCGIKIEDDIPNSERIDADSLEYITGSTSKSIVIPVIVLMIIILISVLSFELDFESSEFALVHIVLFFAMIVWGVVMGVRDWKQFNRFHATFEKGLYIYNKSIERIANLLDGVNDGIVKSYEISKESLIVDHGKWGKMRYYISDSRIRCEDFGNILYRGIWGSIRYIRDYSLLYCVRGVLDLVYNDMKQSDVNTLDIEKRWKEKTDRIWVNIAGITWLCIEGFFIFLVQ